MIDNDRNKTWLRLMEKTWEFCLPMHLAVSWHTPAGVLPIHQPMIVCQHNVRKVSYVMLDASSKYSTIRWILGTRGANKAFIPLWFRSFNPSEMQVVYWTYEWRNRDHLPMRICSQNTAPRIPNPLHRHPRTSRTISSRSPSANRWHELWRNVESGSTYAPHDVS